jgi:peptide/nickel transport system ATP-binding protein
MSVLFITHDMGVVAEIADRVVVMYQGEAVETGSTEAIFNRPDHPYTRRLLAAVPQAGAMDGRALPLRFPTVDLQSGRTRPPGETKDTVLRGGEPLLQVRNLTVRFDVRTQSGAGGRVHAVEDVSFDLNAGETLALVGESGCGKSTTGRALLRLNEPTSGAVKLQGKDIIGLDRRAMRPLRRRMQMIFQDPFASLDPRMKVGVTIGEPLVVHSIVDRSEIRERVAMLLEQVGLEPDMASRYPHEFSGGQRQRLCIARALALEPGLIVADEAVSALDVSVKAQVLNLMLDLQERMGLAYLFISHDMAVVERVSHRVAVMYLGEIVEIGPRARIFSDPRHPYTRRLLSAVTIPDPAHRRHRPLMTEEIKSPIRPLDYVPPAREYREVSPGHLVQAWGEEWESPRARRAG